MSCLICQRFDDVDCTCRRCSSKVRNAIAELPQLQREAGFFIQPGRAGGGSTRTERSIGVNVTALDFSVGIEATRLLHSWESVVRSERKLTPPAMVSPVGDDLLATVTFHLTHLDWSLCQGWAVDFAEEIFRIHARGRAAAKRFQEQVRRIPCPTDDCKKFVVIDVENLHQEVGCFGCGQKWTILRLVALAMSNPNRIFFLDVEAIGLWLGLSQRSVYSIIKTHGIARRGNLYDFGAIVKARSA
jgi:hypothetical protein